MLTALMLLMTPTNAPQLTQFICKVEFSNAKGVINNPIVRDVDGYPAAFQSDNGSKKVVTFKTTPKLKSNGTVTVKFEITEEDQSIAPTKLVTALVSSTYKLGADPYFTIKDHRIYQVNPLKDGFTRSWISGGPAESSIKPPVEHGKLVARPGETLIKFHLSVVPDNSTP